MTVFRPAGPFCSRVWGHKRLMNTQRREKIFEVVIDIFSTTITLQLLNFDRKMIVNIIDIPYHRAARLNAESSFMFLDLNIIFCSLTTTLLMPDFTLRENQLRLSNLEMHYKEKDIFMSLDA